jgi:hypothetical protein
MALVYVLPLWVQTERLVKAASPAVEFPATTVEIGLVLRIALSGA